MKLIVCKEVSGIITCYFIARADNAMGAKEMLKKHGYAAHPKWMYSLTEDEMRSVEVRMSEMMKEEK
ncbi:MAG: hypothetical protein WCV50_01345 [Patescibacteria group bacterium]|jgi:hypothetical protein